MPTHAELVSRAVRWLKNSRGCAVVCWRARMVCTEQPDALGWTGMGWSTLVECKVSRADFRRDLEKWHRKGTGLGNHRFYLTPPGLVRVDEVPEGWGLLECHPATVRVVREWVSRPERNFMEEIRHLVAFASGLLRNEPSEPRHPETDGVDNWII